MDQGKQITLINNLYPMYKLLNISVQSSNIICPFHSDTAPSAHIYPGNRLWCFGKCHRFYYNIHIIKNNNLNIDSLFEELRTEFGDSVLEDKYNLIIEGKEKELKEERVKLIKGETFKDFTNRYFGKITQ